MTSYLALKQSSTKAAKLSPRPLSGGIASQILGAKVALALGAFAIFCFTGKQALSQVTETDQSASFAAGSNGYQSSVPLAGLNLLANPTAVLSASQAPNTDPTASQTYATLVDGSYGTVPNSGGGVEIKGKSRFQTAVRPSLTTSARPAASTSRRSIFLPAGATVAAFCPT